MLIPCRFENNLQHFDVAKSMLKRHSFGIAFAISSILHLMLINFALSLNIQNINPLKKSVYFQVKLLKIATTLPIAASSPVVVAIKVPAKVASSNIKKIHIPHTQPFKKKPFKYASPIINNNLPKNTTQALKISKDSLPAIAQLEVQSSTTAPALVVNTQPDSIPIIVSSLSQKSETSNSAAITAAPVKIGVTISARYAISNLKPEYPALSRRLNEQGTVILKVLVTENGNAGLVEVITSSNYPLLDESAKNAVLRWHFNPATVNGNPISEFYSLTIPFKLAE